MSEFQTLDKDKLEVTTLESLCMNCRQNGVTQLLLVKIPHFREVIVSSFSCEHCGYHEKQVDSAAEIQPKGVRYSSKIANKEGLGRTVVRSGTCVMRIPELGLEDPNQSKTSVVTTVEGLLQKILTNVEPLVPRCEEGSQERANLEAFVARVRRFCEEGGFTLELEDPSGNSFLAGAAGAEFAQFVRSDAQNAALGLDAGQERLLAARGYEVSAPARARLEEMAMATDDIVELPSVCPSCRAEGTSRSAVVHVPYFKEVVVLSFLCERCHFRTVEVKPGGEVGAAGQRLTLTLVEPEDLKRDVMKSADAAVLFPDAGVRAAPGTLGGVLTSIEGLILKVHDQLASVSEHLLGDSAAPEERARMEAVLAKLGDYAAGRAFPFKMVIDDPAANSFIQNYYAPDDDPELVVESYTRTAEQNEELGLTHMRVEDYD